MTVDVGVAHRGGDVGKTTSITQGRPVLVDQPIDCLPETRPVALDDFKDAFIWI